MGLELRVWGFRALGGLGVEGFVRGGFRVEGFGLF